MAQRPEDDLPLPEEPRRSSWSTPVIVLVVVALSLVGVVVLGAIVGLGAVLVPKGTSKAQMLEDMLDLRNIAGLVVATQEELPLARDGRLDVYALLRREGVEQQKILDICRSNRTGKGPSWAEIEAGDYTNFPYQRYKGALDRRSYVETPVVWDRQPTDGERLAAYNDGSARFRAEAAFRSFFTEKPGQE